MSILKESHLIQRSKGPGRELGAIPGILNFSECCTTSRSLVKIYVVYEGIQHFSDIAPCPSSYFNDFSKFSIIYLNEKK